MRPLRAAAWVAAAALLAAAAPPPDLHGPLSDFWARVMRDWDRRIEGLNRGPLQTFIWVAMIWDGPDDLGVERLADRMQEREARRWVRSQITKHRYRRLTRKDLPRMQALRQNIILVGTPEDNDLVARALEPTPLKVDRGFVTVGARRLSGEGLLVFALAPNPVDPSHYALVITGSSAAAILQAGDVPYGETDYVVFRGRKVLDRGFFAWRHGRPDSGTVSEQQSFTDHFNWAAHESARFRIHFDPARTEPGEIADLGHRIDAELDGAAACYGIRAIDKEKIDLYVYASVDEKAYQTADPRPAHFEPADESLHVVRSTAPGGIDAWDVSLAARIVLRRARSLWGETAERELPGLARALSLACRDQFQTIPLAGWAGRSNRDTGYLPMDILLARAPQELDTGDLSGLDAAAFARDLILREGVGPVALFYRTASRSNFRDKFKEIFGVTIAQAESRWLDSLKARNAPSATAPRPAPSVRAPDLGPALQALRRRDDAEAARILWGLAPDTAVLALRARLHFRAGRFAAAVETAQRALEEPGGSAEYRAWARLTLGRARAAMGLLVAAAADLHQLEIQEGPEQVRVIAAFWLEHLGRSLNQRAANQIAMQQADGDLMNFDWDAAESKLRAVLAADPQNRQAHATLGQVYLSRYQYWYDYSLLDRELFPVESQSDPEMYRYLADKGREELRLAASLPSEEGDRWMSETGPVEPAVDQAMNHLLVGKARFLRGEYEAARREFETALALERNDVTVIAYCHLYLARIAAATGDAATARAEYDAVLRSRAGGPVTKLATEELRRLAAPDSSR